MTKIIMRWCCALLLACGSTINAAEVQVTDAGITGTTTWTSDNTYILNGKVFVEDGEVLNVEAGTVIKGKFVEGGGVNSSALIVARGGKIYANGTADAPIVFTSEFDDVNDPSDLGPTDRGLWGGVLILGKAVINSPVEQGVAVNVDNVEGIDPLTEPRGVFGGSNDDDDSGVFRYVSIRHGGALIGADNEINGLTMGGVGRGTTIEFVEVFANLDDGFEWFGGTVDAKYLVAAYCADECFDYDQGYRGRGQFWFGIQDSDGDNAGEHDGDIGTNDLVPLTNPLIYNATYIGAGAQSGVSQNTLRIQDNAGTRYYNSIFTDFGGIGVRVENDGVARVQAGDVVLADNIWWAFGGGNSLETIANANGASLLTDASKNNQFVDPMLGGISREADMGLDPRPVAGSPAMMAGATVPADGFFKSVDHKGAFGSVNWASAWTALGQAGYITQYGAGEPTVISAPISLSAVLENNQMVLKFNSAVGMTYQVVETTALGSAWAHSGAPIVADGTETTVHLDFNTDGNRFFQILQQ